MIFSAVLPLLLMLVLNLYIIHDLRNIKVLLNISKKQRCHQKRGFQVQRFGSKNKLKKELNLFLILLNIVVTFLILHTPRIIVDM